MDGWTGAIGAIFTWLGGESVGAAIARVIIGGAVLRYLSKSNENAPPTQSSSTPQGIRQQISPATENKIPVVYGDAYIGGTIVDVQLVNDNKELYAVLALCEETGDIFSSNVTHAGSRISSNITVDDIYINNSKITFKADATTMDYATDDTGVQDTNGSGLVGIYLYKGGSDAPMLPCQTNTTTPLPATIVTSETTGNVTVQTTNVYVWNTGTLTSDITTTVVTTDVSVQPPSVTTVVTNTTGAHYAPPVAHEVMPGWGPSHVMQNTIFAIVKMNYDPSKGLRSIPNLKFHVRNTLNKPGDVLHDYMTNEMYGGGVAESTIDSTGIAALNTYSDELVTYPGHAEQKRYVINGVVRTTETVMSNMQRIAGAAGSNITYDISTGKWSVVINKVKSKALDFNDSNILGQIAVTGTALDSFYNSVEVQFPYAYLRDQMNFIRVDLPENLRNPNESDNQLQITHELVNNVVQATVLANMDLRQSREDLVITFDTDYSKYNVQVGDVIGITNSVYNWTDKLFKVIRVKKNDSDNGSLTLEITAQQYNDDVYTVESISDFTPTIGDGFSIPNLGAISKPATPTVDTGSSISSQPSITIEAVVPAGVVTEMEFWYTPDDTESNDNLRRYYLLGSTRSENSGPFTTGDTTSFKTVLLNTDNYYFKVRAANEYGTSQFSDPAGPVNYVYKQAPDVLPYNAPVVDENGNALQQAGAGFSVGVLAMYAATKLNWGGLWTDIKNGNISANTLSNLFGISSNTVSSTTSAVGTEENNIQSGVQAGTTANAAISTANSAVSTATTASNTANNAAAAAATANAKADQALAAIAALEGNVEAVTETREFPATILPNIYGPGANVSANSKVGIYTHDFLVFAGSIIPTDEFKLENVVSNTTTISPTVSGKIHNFYNIPDSSGWARPPYYNQNSTDKYAYDSKVKLYYSTADYTSGNLESQSWSNWTLINSSNGVTGTAANTAYTTSYWTNEPPGDPTFDYVAGEDVENLIPECTVYSSYDPFKANIEITETHYTNTDTRNKNLNVTVTGNVPFTPASNKLIMFGVSVMNTPDSVPVTGNTLFGHLEKYTTIKDKLPFKIVVKGGSNYVALNGIKNRLYRSSDGTNWSEITYNDVTHSTNPNWIKADDPETPAKEPLNVLPFFEFLVYDGTKFIAYNTEGGVITSTNGTSWTEYVGNPPLAANTIQVIGASAKYLAVGPNGYQSSTDGISWTTPTKDGIAGLTPYCCVYDGTNYLIGTEGRIGLWQSADKVTWSETPYVSHPNYTTSVGMESNYTAESFAILQNKVEVVALP